MNKKIMVLIGGIIAVLVLTVLIVFINTNNKKYTITFNTDGGTTILNQVIEEGSKVVKPANPEKEGYIFKNWTVDGKEYDFNSSVTKNLVLKANYEKKEAANVNNNGTNKNTISTATNNKPNNNNSSSSSNTSTTPVVAKKYTVIFNSNGGSNISSQTVSEGGKLTQPANPTKEGYTFSGWTLNGAAYNFNSAVNSNITLTATWTQKTYVVKVTLIDTYSPDRILTVYENGTPISVSAIKYSDGYTLCSGSNTTVNKNDIEGENTLIVVLSGGTQVTASVS